MHLCRGKLVQDRPLGPHQPFLDSQSCIRSIRRDQPLRVRLMLLQFKKSKGATTIVALDYCGLATRVEVIVHRDLKQACKGRLAGVEPSKGEGERGGGGGKNGRQKENGWGCWSFTCRVACPYRSPATPPARKQADIKWTLCCHSSHSCTRYQTVLMMLGRSPWQSAVLVAFSAF